MAVTVDQTASQNTDNASAATSTPAAPTPSTPNTPSDGEWRPQLSTRPTPSPAFVPATNDPDATTQAGSSIPKPLINNPQVPSQKMATVTDLNKTSPAPHHAWINQAAEVLAGGARIQTTYDTNGNPVRTKVPVSLPHLGLAIALEVLRGGMAGAKVPDGQPGQAAEAGAQVAQKQRADIQKANQQQDAQAKADQDHKLAVTEANMRIYQTAVNVGKSSKETSQSFSDSFGDLAKGIQDGTTPLPEGVTQDQSFETDAMAAIKNGKTNVTHDLMIPIGEPQPIYDQNGQQKIVNGVPVWGHNYLTIHGADKFQTTLTKDIQNKLHEIGLFQQDGKNAQIGEPNWSFADIAKKMSVYASVKAGEQLLTDHKNDAHDLLGRAPEDLDDLAAAVKSDPNMRKAIGLFSQAQAGTKDSSNIEDILHTMATRDPQSASVLAAYLHLSPTDLSTNLPNARLKAHTEAATKEPQEKALTPEEKAHLQAETSALKSTVGKNTAEVKKINAETDKILNDKAQEGSLIDSIGTGHVVLDRLGYILARKPEIIEAITAKYPDFDSSKASVYPKRYADYTDQKRGSTGGAVNAGATAFKHLNEMLDLNTNTSHIPGTNAYTAYKNKMDTVVSELGQFYGNTTIPGLADFKNTLSSTLPGNRETAIRTQAKSMGDKMNSYEHGWYNAAPSAVYQAPIPWMDHEALVARAKLDPDFAKRPPEGAKFTGKDADTGATYYLNSAHKKIQEVVQGAQ
jgi:hypothetical protein